MGLQAGDYSYYGVGRVFVRIRGAAAARLHIGNVSALDLAVSEDAKKQEDYTTQGGGTVAEVRRITGVELAMTLLDLDKTNLARAFYGTATTVSSGSVVDESHTAYVGGFIPTNKPMDLGATITVKEGATTLTAGTDYEVSSGGITVLSGGALADGDTALISYTSLEHDVVEALTSESNEYEIYFEGLNEAKEGRVVNVAIHRAKLGAGDMLNLIKNDFSSINVKGSLLRDNSKTGTGVSKFFKVLLASGE